MPEPADHPHLLVWYLSGDLEATQARKTEEHLEGCVSCRDELDALASMMQAVERASRELARNNLRIAPEAHFSDTVPAPAVPGSTKPVSMDEPASMAPPRTASPLPPAASRTGGAAALTNVTRVTNVTGVAMVALGGLVVLVAMAGKIGMTPIVTAADRVWPFTSRAATLREVRPVTFLPATRGAADVPRLTGHGPWAVRVLLPSEAGGGTYRVRVERDPRGSIPVAETLARTDVEGRLTLILDTLDGPGQYSMELALPNESTIRYSYPFQFLPVDTPTSSAS